MHFFSKQEFTLMRKKQEGIHHFITFFKEKTRHIDQAYSTNIGNMHEIFLKIYLRIKVKGHKNERLLTLRQ